MPPPPPPPFQYPAPIGPQEPLGRKVKRKVGEVVDDARDTRDEIYGYRRKKGGGTTKSNVGRINFFGGNPFQGMDPFNVHGTDAARSVRGTRRSHRRPRREDDDDY